MSEFLPKKPQIIIDGNIDDALQINTDIILQELLRIKSQTVRGAPLDRDELARLKLYNEMLTKTKTAQREAPATTNKTVVINQELKALPTEELVKRLKKADEDA